MTQSLSLGLDFGTESVRALFVGLDGHERAVAVQRYSHGQVLGKLPSGKPLPPLYALQDPHDWIDAAAVAVHKAMKIGSIDPADVIGIGVDFTSCTMLPCKRDGVPLCKAGGWDDEPLAWPKLWKHHGAQAQADRFTQVAAERGEKWLPRYGGTIGLEWFFPKILETLETAPKVYDAADIWVEGGDWFVWQLVGGDAVSLPRSTCQAGYKAQWNRDTGYPSRDYFKAVHPGLGGVLDRMPGRLLAPGEKAGELTKSMAERLGLRAGTVVSAAMYSFVCTRDIGCTSVEGSSARSSCSV